MKNQLKALQCAGWFLILASSAALLGQGAPTDPVKLLDHLAGRWILEGKLGNKQVVHEVTADWILNHEYLRMHEMSREKSKSGSPTYEAIILFAWDDKDHEYRCLWLDNTDGGGLSVPIARGKGSQESIQIEFPPPYDSIHTRLNYDSHTDHWQMIIDDIKDGEPYRFGDVVLSRLSPASLK